MTGIELQVLERYLNAPHGSTEAMDALAEIINMVDVRREQITMRGLMNG